MADSPQDLLNDPEFQKLSPEAQHIVIGKRFPEYASLSPEAQKIVLSKAAPAEPKTTFGIPLGFGQSQEVSMTPEELQQFQKEGKRDVVLGAGMAASMVGGEIGLPFLARAGLSGTTVGVTSAATGSSPGDALKDAAIQGALPEAGGAALGKVGEGLTSVSKKALARILRLGPKAFEFGKEPAAEVLEQGIAGNSLPKLVENIGVASKETTAQLNTLLKGTAGTVNAENIAIDVANSLPGTAGNRFLKVVDDAADKLGLRSNQLSNLSAADMNALKQEISKQGRFVENDLKQSVGSAVKAFGGRAKDEIIKLNPDTESLLQTSANLTEAKKSGDYAVRMEKAGRGKGPLADVEANRPVTYPHILTDSTTGAKTLFRIAGILKDTVAPSQALRMAFNLAFPNAPDIP
jgi:hypothetical protein